MTELLAQADKQLYVGGHCAKVQGEYQDLAGDRMYTAAHRPERAQHVGPLRGLLDWQTTLAQLRATAYYRRPPAVASARQECFL